MKKRRFGKRLLTGTLCIGMVTSMLTTTAMAAPYDDLTIAGVAAAVIRTKPIRRIIWLLLWRPRRSWHRQRWKFRQKLLRQVSRQMLFPLLFP